MSIYMQVDRETLSILSRITGQAAELMGAFEQTQHHLAQAITREGKKDLTIADLTGQRDRANQRISQLEDEAVTLKNQIQELREILAQTKANSWQ